MSKGNFSRNVLKLAAGNSAAQLVSIATVPVITRLYDPAQFGIFSMFIGAVALIVPISTLQYHAAIALPETERSAWLLRKVSLGVVAAFALLSLIGAVIVALGEHYGNWAVALVPDGVIWLIAPAVLIQGMLLVDTTWLMRRNAFGRAAAARVWESVIDRLIGIGFGLWQPAAIFLAAGKTFGGVAAWWYARRIVSRESALPADEPAGKPETPKQLAYRYRAFAIFSSMAVLVGAAARELPVILLGAIFGPAYAAYYALGLRVVNMPMMTVGDAVAKAFFQHTAVLARSGENLAEPALRLVKVGLLLAAPPLLLLAAHGQGLFGMIFGARWVEAGLYAAALAPVYLIQFVGRPIETLYDVLERQRAKLAWASAGLAGRMAAIVAVVAWGGTAIEAIVGLMLVTVLTQAGVMRYLLRKIGVTHRQMAGVAARMAGMLAPALIGIPAAAFLLEARTGMLVGMILMLAQMGALFLLDQDMRQIARKVLKRAG